MSNLETSIFSESLTNALQDHQKDHALLVCQFAIQKRGQFLFYKDFQTLVC